MFNKQELASRIASIDGWLSENEGFFLYQTARSVLSDQWIVEIGSWKGKSTVYLGLGSLEGSQARILAIDPHTGASEHVERFGKVWTFDEFKKNIENGGVASMVEPYVGTSEQARQAWDTSRQIGFLWIDGAHEFEFVDLDVRLWTPLLPVGSTVAFHDSAQDGPRRVIWKTIFASGRYKNIRLYDSILAAERCPFSFFQLGRNMVFGFSLWAKKYARFIPAGLRGRVKSLLMSLS